MLLEHMSCSTRFHHDSGCGLSAKADAMIVKYCIMYYTKKLLWYRDSVYFIVFIFVTCQKYVLHVITSCHVRFAY